MVFGNRETRWYSNVRLNRLRACKHRVGRELPIEMTMMGFRTTLSNRTQDRMFIKSGASDHTLRIPELNLQSLITSPCDPPMAEVQLLGLAWQASGRIRPLNLVLRNRWPWRPCSSTRVDPSRTLSSLYLCAPPAPTLYQTIHPRQSKAEESASQQDIAVRMVIPWLHTTLVLTYEAPEIHRAHLRRSCYSTLRPPNA